MSWRLSDLLQAVVLTKQFDPQRLAQAFTVGAMTMQAASRASPPAEQGGHHRGDRTDIQLAALETSTVALILTGNLHPSPLVLGKPKRWACRSCWFPQHDGDRGGHRATYGKPPGSTG
jgi:BioD-like phosphotransacetylase family protein